MPTYQELIRQALGKLPRLEAEVLLGKVLGKERVYIHIHSDEEAAPGVEEAFHRLAEDRSQGTPLHYLLGEKEWMGLPFRVTPATLIPREDTRILLEALLQLKESLPPAPLLLEIGTGSGILPVLLGKSWPEARLCTTEINPETLAVARENFLRHGIAVAAYQTDFLEEPARLGLQADVLYSNPPYISREEYEELEEEVRREPSGALLGGDDGLSYYRRLGQEYQRVLKPGGYVALEIGWKQAQEVRQILENAGLTFLCLSRDDGDRDRVLTFRYQKGC